MKIKGDFFCGVCKKPGKVLSFLIKVGNVPVVLYKCIPCNLKYTAIVKDYEIQPGSISFYNILGLKELSFNKELLEKEGILDEEIKEK